MKKRRHPDTGDDPRYTTASINPLTLRYLVAVVTERGAHVPALCRGLGFEAGDLDDPDFKISYRQASMMISRAMQWGGDSGLGLAVGLRQTPISWGLVGFGMMSCATLADAIDFGLRFQKDAGSLASISQERSRNQTALVADLIFYDPDIEVFLVEEMFASMISNARFLVGPQVAPIAVDLIYQAPAHAGWYQSIFRCPVHFGRPRNRIILSQASVSQPLATHDPVVAKRVRELIEESLLAHREDADFGATVERTIRENLRVLPPLSQIAAQMNMSERTLRRRLLAAGFRYQVLVDSVRKARSLELLSHSRLPVAAVAQEMGFADVRSFRRAFRRWMGVAPTEIRERSEG